MRRRGFNLIELLVVVSIIGLLVGLLLPAVQSSREAARRAKCANNLHQIGLALHSYESSFKHFPLGYVSSVAGANETGPGWSWATALLPFMEQNSLYASININRNVEHADNQTSRSIQLQTYLCPSDPVFARDVDVPDYQNNIVCSVSGSNYLAVFGSLHSSCKRCRWQPDGSFGRNFGVSHAALTRGTSQTLAVGERGHRMSFATWTGVVPESKLKDNAHVDAGYVGGPAYVLGSFNFDPEDPTEIDPEIHSDGDGEQFDFRIHPGGCNFLYFDGHVDFLKETTNRSLLQQLSTREGKGGKPTMHTPPQ